MILKGQDYIKFKYSITGAIILDHLLKISLIHSSLNARPANSEDILLALAFVLMSTEPSTVKEDVSYAAPK